MQNRWISFKGVETERGLLVALEGSASVPFAIKRIYYITDVGPEISRGFHAHKNLKQVAICAKGSCRFVLDDGKSRNDFVLDDPTKGIFIDSMTWREMHEFSRDCVLIVIASEHYDESDYIRDYDEFLRLTSSE